MELSCKFLRGYLLLLIIQELFSYSGTIAVHERFGGCWIWHYTCVMSTVDSKQRLKKANDFTKNHQE